MNRTIEAVAFLGALAGFLTICTTQALALNESSARAEAMGRTYTAVARNLDAVGWNPANLGLPSDRKVSIGIFSLGGGVGNDAYSLGDYDRYNGQTWSEATRREILSKIPADGMTFNAAVEGRALGISYGRYAVRAAGFGSARGRFPKDPVDLILFGNEPDRVYTVDDTEGKGQAIWNLSVSGAYPIEVEGLKAFSVGMTVRYLRGEGYFELQNAQGSLVTQTTGWKLEGSALARRAEGGSGFSVDFGAAVELRDGVTVGLALIHLGTMSWNEDAREHSGSVGTDSLDVEDLVDVEEFEDLFSPVAQERVLNSFGTSLPTILRAGIAGKTKRFLLAVDWEQGLNNSPGSTTRPRFAVGAEYLLAGWLPLRAGLSLGGRNRTSFTAGFGLGVKPVAFDLALRVRKGVVPRAAGGAGFALELKVGF